MEMKPSENAEALAELLVQTVEKVNQLLAIKVIVERDLELVNEKAEQLRTENAALKADVSKWMSLHKATADLCEKTQKQLAALKSQEPVYLVWRREAWHEAPKQMYDAADEDDRWALFTAPQPAVPAGWKLVPIEPTKEMQKAGSLENDSPDFATLIAVRTYKAMVLVAPEAPQAQDKDGERHAFLKGVLYAAAKYEANRSERFTGGDVSDFLTMEAHELSADDVDQAMKESK